MKSVKKPDKFWIGKRVLVTGGAGFVGSWLSAELALRQSKVVVLDIKSALPRLGGQHDRLLKKVSFVRGDVSDAALLKRLFVKYKFDIVFHLAAEVIVGEVFDNPAEALDTNIIGTVRVLEEVRKYPRTHVVVASSDKAYGSQKNLPYREDSPLLGVHHPYDCSKASADQITRMYADVYKISAAVTRCGNIYGGGDLHFSRIIPGTIESLLQDKAIELRSDGSYIRDYIYVQDVVSAYLCTAEWLASGKVSGEAFNFGDNKPIQVLKLVKMIYRLAGKTHLKPIIRNNAKNEITNQYLDASKAKRILGWTTQYRIEEGLQETIDWYKRFLN